jgi:nucleotide-binding universal stress UspA family protein
VEPGHADDSHDSPEKPAPIASDRPLVNTDDEPRVVLAAVDTSPAAKRVISMAARFVRAYPQATLHVLHVLRTSRLDRAQAAHAGVPGTSSEAMEDAKDHLEYHKRLAISQCRNTVIGHFTTGNPTGEILRFCSELKVDLLVIATHDHLGFERLLLGSIAETLVRKAPCSVTVVRQASHSTGS